MFKRTFKQVFDKSFNVNLCKKKGFLTSIPCIPIPEYGQSNAPSVERPRVYPLDKVIQPLR